MHLVGDQIGNPDKRLEKLIIDIDPVAGSPLRYHPPPDSRRFDHPRIYTYGAGRLGLSIVILAAGQGTRMRSSRVPEADIYRFVDGVAQTIDRCVDAMPAHQAFIDRCCAATAPA